MSGGAGMKPIQSPTFPHRHPYHFVIAGLVPAIHTLRQGQANPECSVNMDPRHKAGDDEWE